MKVIDRGPFHEYRLFVLSFVAALKLVIVAEGTDHNKKHTHKNNQTSETKATTSTAPEQHTTPEKKQQAGAFADRANAERLAQRIAAAAPRCGRR